MTDDTATVIDDIRTIQKLLHENLEIDSRIVTLASARQFNSRAAAVCARRVADQMADNHSPIPSEAREDLMAMCRAVCMPLASTPVKLTWAEAAEEYARVLEFVARRDEIRTADATPTPRARA